MADKKLKKIAISCAGKDLNGAVDPRFGRCVNFLITNEKGEQLTVIPNEAAFRGGGAGIQAAQVMIDNDVSVVLTGNMGPNAFGVLKGAGVEIYLNCSGTAKKALEDYRNGALTSATESQPRGFGPMNRGRAGGSD